MTGYFDTFEVNEDVKRGELLTDVPPGNWLRRTWLKWRYPQRLYKTRPGQQVRYIADRAASAHNRVRVQFHTPPYRR